ncbi:MAG: hypothetical protein WCA20_27675 [Candidatus Sulfotelmatobacter sp.]
MKKSYFTIVLTLTVLLGAGINALAQDTDRVIVKVPFEFVAGSKTLPAATYTIDRVFPVVSSGLRIRSYGNGEFLLPIDADYAPGGPAKLSFEHVGGKYFLSKVETPERIYNIGASPEMIKLGKMGDNGNESAAGGN